jgi:hypothetical protein
MRRHNVRDQMVANITRIEYSWFVTVIPKYLNCDTFSNDLFPIFIFWCWSAFWSRDTNIYLVFSNFLMRGQIWNLLVQLLLDLASSVTLGSKSRITCDWMLLSHLRLGSLFVTSYESQGLWRRYSIQPPHGGLTVEIKDILWPTVRLPVCFGIGYPPMAHNQILITEIFAAVFFLDDHLDERTGL